MAITRKEFMLTVTEEMLKNPRTVLAGHGITSAVLQRVIERPDVIAKMALTLYSTKQAKKGAAGLKKANNLWIKGYKNFPEFNLKAREDVEAFVGQLSPEDQSDFTNNGNIVCLYVAPQKPEAVDKTNSEEVANAISEGKTVMLSFDQAVRKEYATPGGFYVTIMLGLSAARPTEEKLAERKEKVNKKKNSRRTPARIKAELAAKANKKLARLKAETSDLQDEAWRTEKQMQQFRQIGKSFGVTGGSETNIIGAINKFGAQSVEARAAIMTAVNALPAEEKGYYNTAMKFIKAGKGAQARSIARLISNPTVVEFLTKQKGMMPQDGMNKIDARKSAIQSELRSLVKRGQQLMVDLSLAPADKKVSIRSMMSKNSSKIKELRAKLGTYDNISVEGYRNKAKMLKEVNAKIQANIAAGLDIQTALNNAIASIDAKASEKQIIKQQVIEQIANGTPMQYAVQQAIQQTIQAPAATNLAGGATTIEDVLNML